jgi:acyl-[acyl-carrier-protein]-phospholipid O-acyltransferase/long-chain-fatty-acid--[acyl-carrier-protein] ligase
VEDAVRKALALGEDALNLAVAGVPDKTKGEALVIISTKEINLSALRNLLAEAGIPNLWIPRKVILTSEIPHLASGKLDLRRLQELAQSAGESVDPAP